MGWKDALFKKDPFEDTDEPKKNEPVKAEVVQPAPVVQQQQTVAQPTIQQPVFAQTMTAPPTMQTKSIGLNQKIYDVIHAEVMQSGTLFIKFIELYDKMNKIIPNTQQCVAAVLTSIASSPDEILVSNQIQSTIERIKMEFDGDINIFVTENITTKDQEVQTLKTMIENNENTIKTLQAENESLTAKGQELYSAINESKFKIDQKKADFEYALNTELQYIDGLTKTLEFYKNTLKEPVNG